MSEVRTALTLEDLSEVAQWVLVQSKHPVLLFYGEMGAGKTTLIKNIADQLQVEDDVNSPTFSLVNEYFSKKAGTIYHFDFYRLNDETEALDIGLEDYLDSGQLCLIEWPDKIRNFLPSEFTSIQITEQNGSRNYELTNIDRA